MGERAGGNCPLHFEKLRGQNSFAPLILALNLRKNFFTLVWKHILSSYWVSQGYKDIWTRVCFETSDFFFFIAAVLKIYQTKEYIFCKKKKFMLHSSVIFIKKNVWKPHNFFFYWKYVQFFSHSEWIWCFWHVVFEYLIKRKGVEKVG